MTTGKAQTQRLHSRDSKSAKSKKKKKKSYIEEEKENDKVVDV